MKTNIISPKVLILLQLLILSFGLYLLDNFIPDLPLDPTIDSTQAGTIRFLFSFTFYSPTSSRFGILLLFILTTASNIVLLLWTQVLKISEYFRTWFGFLALFHYFAWIFVQRYSPNYAAQIQSLFIDEIILRGVVFLTIFLICFTFQKIMISRKMKQPETLLAPIPKMEFICPHCQAKYTSNVKYCVHCHQLL